MYPYNIFDIYIHFSKKNYYRLKWHLLMDFNFYNNIIFCFLNINKLREGSVRCLLNKLINWIILESRKK